MDVETRASDLDRDAALLRLHDAYAEGRLDEDELDERMRLVLGARTLPQLERQLADLPVRPACPPAARGAEPSRPVEPSRVGGRWQLAAKSSVRRGGRWLVPRRFTVAIYKGGSLIDLSSAELTEPVTTIRALAYKSDIEIVVPPGVRLELGGLGVSGVIDDAPDSDAPVVRVKGFAYKGAVEVRSATSPG